MNASRVLAEQARSLEAAPPPVSRAVEGGTATVDQRLDAPRLVATENRYFVVYEVGSQSFLVEKPLTERLLELAAIFLGILVLHRAWREGSRSTHD